MAAEAGFNLNGEFFPWAEHYDMGDAIIIERVTGMDLQEFAEAGDTDGGRASVSVMAGMMAAAMRHKHPGWKHRHIEELIQNSDLAGDNIEFINPEPVAEVVQLPPPATDDAASSGESSSTSTDEPASSSDETPPSDSGEQTSLTSTA